MSAGRYKKSRARGRHIVWRIDIWRSPMQENSENDLCSCGSGRKYKNCCLKSKTKERYQRLKYNVENVSFQKVQVIIYSDTTTELGIKLLNENGEEIKTTLSEMQGYYERENKTDKILFSQPVADNKYIRDINRELVKYDAILVIDTSYEMIENTKMAFTSMMIFWKLSGENDNFNYKLSSQVIEWDATPVDKPENLMYAEVIENVRVQNNKYNQSPKIAVIVDSDLDNISYFNGRTKPIFENYYLPEKFHMFYASSDSGNENFQNKLLRICDNEAKNALFEYKREMITKES